MWTDQELHALHDVDTFCDWLYSECLGRRADPDMAARGSDLDVPHLLARLLLSEPAKGLRNAYLRERARDIREAEEMARDTAEMVERADEIQAKVERLAKEMR